MTQHYEIAPIGFRPTFKALEFWQCEPLYDGFAAKQVARVYSEWAKQVTNNMMALGRVWEDYNPELMAIALNMHNQSSSVSKLVPEVSVMPATRHEIVQILNRGWFSSVLDTRDYVVKALKEMPYEDYLQTVHWKYVRFSKIILLGAMCSWRYCANRKPMWDDLANLHIHHETYENRGCEKPEDLSPLCVECHELAHQPAEARAEAAQRYLESIDF